MKKLLLTLTFLLGSLFAYTQNDPWLFQLGIEKQSDSTDVVQLNLMPNFDVTPFQHPNDPSLMVYPYYYTTTMTVRWETSANIQVDPSSIALVDPTWQSLLTLWGTIIYFPHYDTINGYSYATFNTSGIFYTYVSMNAYEIYPFIQFEFFNPDSNCVVLEVVDDAFQCGNENISWWCSIILFDQNNNSYPIPQGGFDVVDLCFGPQRYIDGQQQVLIGGCSTEVTEEVANDINIYPNPTDQTLQIIPQSKEYVFFEIYDVYGRIIRSGRVNSQGIIDVGSLRSGNYMIKFFDEQRREIYNGKYFNSRKRFIKL